MNRCHSFSATPVRRFAATLFLMMLPALALAAPCVVTDNGSGTVNLPPNNCGYVSPADLHVILNGLPPGTQINIGVEHHRFFNVTNTPGGTLGGEVEQFQSELKLDMNGAGAVRQCCADGVCSAGRRIIEDR